MRLYLWGLITALQAEFGNRVIPVSDAMKEAEKGPKSRVKLPGPHANGSEQFYIDLFPADVRNYNYVSCWLWLGLAAGRLRLDSRDDACVAGSTAGLRGLLAQSSVLSVGLVCAATR